MSFSDQVAAMDATLIAAFGGDEKVVTLRFLSGGGFPDLTVPFITENPALKEDYVPGSTTGTTVLFLFVHLTPDQLAVSRYPVNGDRATVAGVDYDVFQVDTDREDGRSLRMRRRGQRFDQ